MDISNRLAISYYKTIATLNEDHGIYLVQHQQTNRIYVKKVLDVYNYGVYVSLFRHHIPGTPRIIELCKEDHQLIVIEDFISGETLQDKIESKTFDIDLIYRYATELCSILEKLHALTPPIIHRDIKPSNVIITEHNHVILLDFNAAKYFDEAADKDTVLLGTKGYAAPEQYGFGASSPKTDIYAVGVLLKELSQALSLQDDVLNKIVAHCIQIDPGRRYSSITDLKRALEQASAPKKVNIERSSSLFFLPPGYRTVTPWKMMLASIGYLSIFWLCLSLQVKNASVAHLWIERIFSLLIILSIILVNFNYLDVQRYFPPCKHKSKFLHYIGILLWDVAVIILLLIIMLIVVSIFA